MHQDKHEDESKPAAPDPNPKKPKGPAPKGPKPADDLPPSPPTGGHGDDGN